MFILSGANLAYENLYKNKESNDKTEIFDSTQPLQQDLNQEIEEKMSNDDIQNTIWTIEIPKINLAAPIAKGTSQEILKEYVGHFENTKYWNGNIGLAAHNRRFPYKLF